MWRNIRNGEILDVEKYWMWRNSGCGEIWDLWRFPLLCQVNRFYNSHCFARRFFLMKFAIFCCKISFVAIYAVFFSRDLLCCDLRTFYEKISQNFVRIEKMSNITGILCLIFWSSTFVHGILYFIFWSNTFVHGIFSHGWGKYWTKANFAAFCSSSNRIIIIIIIIVVVVIVVVTIFIIIVIIIFFIMVIVVIIIITLTIKSISSNK